MCITRKIDENLMTRILEQIPTVEELYLYGNISYINLDSLVNLRELSIAGTFDRENFNFDLLKNLCKQLEKLKIVLTDLDEKSLFKLFNQFFNIDVDSIYKVVKMVYYLNLGTKFFHFI
jgi:hypothetical protein